MTKINLWRKEFIYPIGFDPPLRKVKAGTQKPWRNDAFWLACPPTSIIIKMPHRYPLTKMMEAVSTFEVLSSQVCQVDNKD